MPSLTTARAVQEARLSTYAAENAIDIEEQRIYDRAVPAITIFTDHVRPKRQKRVLHETIDNITVLPSGHAALHDSPVWYLRYNDEILIDEEHIDTPGVLESGIVCSLGFWQPMRGRVLPHMRIALGALSAYASPNDYGLPTKNDDRLLRHAKRFLPEEFHGRRVREASHRHGNLARILEDDRPFEGLRHIYGLTR